VFIAETIAIALQNIETLERHAREVAHDFRSADLQTAHRGLRHLVQSTRMLLRLAAMSAHATGTEIRDICRATRSTADRQMQHVLDQLTAVLIARDARSVASLLEREYVTALAAWRPIFETLNDACFDPDPGGRAA
jgi:hypothetical protein